MKCPNCGANYSLLHLHCPYCGTPNPRGLFWKNRRDEADAAYADALRDAKSQKLLALSRFADRLLMILGAAFAPIFLCAFLFFGAGSAANGVGGMIAKYIAHALDVPIEAARKQIRMIDIDGLITTHRTKFDGQNALWACDAPECKDLLQIVRDFKPTALMGLSGQPKQFSKEVLEEMCKHCKRPIVFALSNPTSKSECTAEEAYTYTDGTCIFASGSPFDPVTYKGKTYTPGQGNNMYIFPGLGFGAKLAKAKVVTEDMIMSTAITLAGCVTKEQLEQGMIYPRVADVQDISRKVAAGVIRTAIKNGVCQLSPVPEDIDKYVADSQWKVEYPHM